MIIVRNGCKKASKTMLYQDIPREIREYVDVGEREFNRMSKRAQNVILRDAKQSYQEDHMDDDDVEKEEFPEGLFDIEVVERDHKTKGRKKTKWSERRVIATAPDPVALDPHNLESFGIIIDRVRDDYTSDGFVPYQYTLAVGDNFVNSSPNSLHLMSLVDKHLEQYEYTFLVHTFTIAYKKGYKKRTHHGGISAGNGQGIPRYITGGYWELDIFQTKYKCIQNSYSLWTMYRDGKLNDVIQGKCVEFYERRSKLSTEKSVKINDIVNNGDEFDVMYEHDDVFDIHPSETKDKCWFIYNNNHVGLLIHENFISKKSIAILKKRSKDTIIHQISPKKRKPEKIEIVTADIECYRKHVVVDKEMSHVTYMTTHEPLLVGQYSRVNGFKYFRGENALDKYCEYLHSVDQDWLIWFHNAGKYDTHFLLGPIMRICNTDLNNPIEMRDLNGKLIEAKCHLMNGRTVTIRDSCSIIPGSLKKLAKDMGVTQKQQDVDIKNVSRNDILCSHKILEYNRDDCVALYDVLCAYQKVSIETFGSNPLQHVSGSSFAKRVFFSDYYDHENYPLYVLSKRVHEFISEGYGGGRNEVFKRGRYKATKRGKRWDILIYTYDFTSFYPAVGRLPVPYGKPRYMGDLDNIKTMNVDKFLEDNPGFYRVTVLSSPRDKQPIHGVFYKHKYVFPDFKNYYGLVLFSKEIQLGISAGYKYKLHYGYRMELAPICEKFFEKMISVKTEAKAQGKLSLTWAAKITANSGYGYFGFDPYNRTVLRIYGKNMEEHVESLADNAQLSYRREGDAFICHERTNVMLPDVNVAVAAAITSYARMRLWELIQDIKDAGGEVYYCDTDSVHCSIDIVDHKILGPKWCGLGKGKNLGELKRELPKGEDVIDAAYVGCKTYCYETNKERYIVKSKGTNNPKAMDELEDEIPADEMDEWIVNKAKCLKMSRKLKKLLHEPQTFQTESISTSRIRKVQKDMVVTDRGIMKNITGIYTKGLVGKDGDVVPYLLTTGNVILDRNTSEDKLPENDENEDDWEVRHIREQRNDDNKLPSDVDWCEDYPSDDDYVEQEEKIPSHAYEEEDDYSDYDTPQVPKCDEDDEYHRALLATADYPSDEE